MTEPQSAPVGSEPRLAGENARPMTESQSAREPHAQTPSAHRREGAAEARPEPGRPSRPIRASADPAAGCLPPGLSSARVEPLPARPSPLGEAAPAPPSERGDPVEEGARRIGAPPSVRRIELRLADRPAEAVTVQVAERGGRIELELRTPDRDLAASLTERAPEIVRRLETAGFRVQAFAPQSAARALEAVPESTLQNGPDFNLFRDDGRQGGAGRHPNEQHRRESDPDAPVEGFFRPDSDEQEVDS